MRAVPERALRLRLSEEELARFAVNSWTSRRRGGALPDAVLSAGGRVAATSGYVGRIDEGDLRAIDDTDVASRYAGTPHRQVRGRAPGTRTCCIGQPGYEEVETNADGRSPWRVLERSPRRTRARTIDVGRLQEAAEAAFERPPGAAVAIDPRNGEVLALREPCRTTTRTCSSTASRADYSALLARPDRPCSTAPAGGYPPGSTTVKPFVGLALELGSAPRRTR